MSVDWKEVENVLIRQVRARGYDVSASVIRNWSFAALQEVSSWLATAPVEPFVPMIIRSLPRLADCSPLRMCALCSERFGSLTWDQRRDIMSRERDLLARLKKWSNGPRPKKITELGAIWEETQALIRAEVPKGG